MSKTCSAGETTKNIHFSFPPCFLSAIAIPLLLLAGGKPDFVLLALYGYCSEHSGLWEDHCCSTRPARTSWDKLPLLHWFPALMLFSSVESLFFFSPPEMLHHCLTSIASPLVNTFEKNVPKSDHWVFPAATPPSSRKPLIVLCLRLTNPAATGGLCKQSKYLQAAQDMYEIT